MVSWVDVLVHAYTRDGLMGRDRYSGQDLGLFEDWGSYLCMTLTRRRVSRDKTSIGFGYIARIHEGCKDLIHWSTCSGRQILREYNNLYS